MSYFIFGRIYWSCSSHFDRHLIQVSNIARKVGIHAHTNEGIPQRIICEMLSSVSPRSPNWFAFLMTSTPTDDTSHELIQNLLKGRTNLVCRFFDRLLDITEANYVELWLTEGYDDAFEEIHCNLQETESILKTRIVDCSEVPSLRLIISAR